MMPRFAVHPLLRFVAGLLLLGLPALAVPAGQPAARAEQQFDLPAQSLGAALTVFAKTAHLNIAFETDSVSKMRSAALRGRFTPEVALHRLLAGTGHTAAFTGPRSAVVYRIGSAAPRTAGSRIGPVSLDLDLAEVRAAAPVRIGQHDVRTGLAYARNTEREIQSMLGNDPSYRGKPLRLLIAIGTDPEGRISHVRVGRGSGVAEPNRTLAERLLGHKLPGAPPPGLVQPMWFDIEVRGLIDSQRDGRER